MIAVRQVVPIAAAGLTQASSVTPVVRSSDGLSRIATVALVPLNDRPAPFLPVVRVAFAIVPLLLRPEASSTALPDGSSKPKAATCPVGTGDTVLSTVTATEAEVVT